MNKFGLLYKTYLFEKDIKQIDIASRMGVTQATVSKTIKADNITLDQMLKLSDAVDCDLELKLIPREKV